MMKMKWIVVVFMVLSHVWNRFFEFGFVSSWEDWYDMIYCSKSFIFVPILKSFFLSTKWIIIFLPKRTYRIYHMFWRRFDDDFFFFIFSDLDIKLHRRLWFNLGTIFFPQSQSVSKH
jgi:hypothetical protein